MSAAGVADRIHRLAERAGCAVGPDLTDGLIRYLTLLARWNRTVNLTSFELDPPSDEALDRLIVEPLVAARYVQPEDRLCMDIGSGGGSPAIPMKLAVPALRVTMVETRARKAAFLQEVIRQLGIAEASVETARFEDVARRPEVAGHLDLVTARAVRVDGRLSESIAGVLRPGGRFFWFSSDPGLVRLSFLRAIEEVQLTQTKKLQVYENR